MGGGLGGGGAAHGLCTAQLRDLIRIGANASAYEHAVNPHSSTLAFQRELSSQYLEGAYALSNGYLLTATILSAMLVHIIDGQDEAQHRGPEP